jgi:hypothetical protein
MAASSSAVTLERLGLVWGMGAEIRVLVAFEDDYHVYRDTIGAVLRILRPETEVKSTTPEAFEEELVRSDSPPEVFRNYRLRTGAQGATLYKPD